MNQQCHKTADLQSAGVTNFPTLPYLVPQERLELYQGINYIVTGTVLQYLHKGTSMSCYLVLHYTKLWCPRGDSNSQNLASKTSTYTNSVTRAFFIYGGCGWSRTNSAIRREIYSLLGLPVFLHIQTILKHTKGNAILLSQYVGCCLMCFNMSIVLLSTLWITITLLSFAFHSVNLYKDLGRSLLIFVANAKA